VVFPVAKTFTSHGVKFVHGEATTIDPAAQQVQTTQGPLGFDYLVIATGYLNNFEVVPGPVRRLRGRSDGTPGRAAPRHHRVHPRAGLLAAGSDRLAVAEELVVLVVAAVAPTDLGEVRDELDAGDPLHLLEAELDLVAQAQRRAVAVGQRLAVHVVGEHGEGVAHLLDGVRVVVEAPLRPVAERVEDDPAGFGFRPHEIEDRCHRHPAPLRHP
jgi:hypothetical protein